MTRTETAELTPSRLQMTTIDDIHSLAAKFRGNAEGFFEALEAKCKVVGPAMRRSFEARNTVKPSEKFAKIFAEIEAPKPSAVEQVGRSVISLATDPNPKISKPIVAGIQKSLAAQQKLMSAAEFEAQTARPQMLLSEFHILSQRDRAAYIRGGGRLAETAEPAVAPLDPNAKTATRSQFEKLPHAERAGIFRRGGKLVSEPSSK